jgi:hypothetical protein
MVFCALRFVDKAIFWGTPVNSEQLYRHSPASSGVAPELGARQLHLIVIVVLVPALVGPRQNRSFTSADNGHNHPESMAMAWFARVLEVSDRL